MKDNINKSAYNFFLCLIFIMEKGTFSVDELISHIENTYEIFIFKETALKYLRTMKAVGFEFERLNNITYKVKKIPFKITAGKDEENVIIKCAEALKNYHVSNSGYDKYLLFEKLQLFLPKDLRDVFNKKLIFLNYQEYKDNYMLETIKKYCKEGQRLNITYLKDGKTKQQHMIEPSDIFVTKSATYLRGFDLINKENLLINFDWISDITQTPLKNKFLYKKQHVTLKFLSKFAKSYTLKDGEEIIKKEPGALSIRSFYYDKNLFFKNILRYMENCEIVAPEALRKDFLKYTEDLYQIYDCPNVK